MFLPPCRFLHLLLLRFLLSWDLNSKILICQSMFLFRGRRILMAWGIIRFLFFWWGLFAANLSVCLWFLLTRFLSWFFMFRLFSFHHFFLVFYLKCFRFVLLLLIYLTINLILFSLNALCDLCECGLWGCLMLCLDPLLLKLCRLLLLLGFLVRRKGCLFIGIIQLYCFQKLIFFLLVIYLQKEYNQIHLFEFYFHLIIKNYLNHCAMRINYFIL